MDCGKESRIKPAIVGYCERGAKYPAVRVVAMLHGMLDLFKRQYHPPGTAPGTLTPVTDERPARGSMTVRRFDPESREPYASGSLADQPALGPREWLWVHLQGIPSTEQLEALQQHFDLHPLALEDVVNRGQRPKVEIDEGLAAITLQQAGWRDDAIRLEQFNLFVGPDFVVSIHEGEVDPFGPIHRRLHKAGNSRGFAHHGPAYLGYALIDLVVDQAFPLLERLGGRIEALESEVLEAPERETQQRIHRLRRDMLLLRRQLWPSREALGRLLRDGEEIFGPGTRPYLRDTHDHVVQIMELLESYREMAASLVDAYLTGVNHRLNEVMKVLTVIATIFIPLTFVVGVYGMNFEHPESPWAMPELAAYYGYPVVWLIMVLVAGGMLYAFRRRGWF